MYNKFIIIGFTSQGENAFCKAGGVVLSRTFCYPQISQIDLSVESVDTALLSVITGAMADFEFFFFQVGICDLNRDLAIRAVTFFVG